MVFSTYEQANADRRRDMAMLIILWRNVFVEDRTICTTFAAQGKSRRNRSKTIKIHISPI